MDHPRSCVTGLALSLLLLPPPLAAQIDSLALRQKRQSQAAERAGLAEPFKGITTNGTVREGLFPLRSTGVSTEPVVSAARAFLAALAPSSASSRPFRSTIPSGESG